MAGRTSYYGGVVLDGLVFHIDAAKQESYAKRGLRYMQNGNNNLFIDFADTSKSPSTLNATGSIINGATFSNFVPYHLTPYYSPYWNKPGSVDMIPSDTRNSSPVWSTLEHSWDANGDALDSKGTAHGSVVTPSGQNFSPSTMTYQSGKVGSGAFSFNGSNFITLPENTLKFTTYVHPYEYPRDFSVSLWFYVPAGLTDSYLISSFHNTGDYTEYNGWGITYNNTAKSINFFIGIKMGAPGNPSSQYYSISLTTGNNAFQVNQWNHVLVTRKVNTRSRIYVNGVLSASDTNIYDPSYHSTPNLSYIGASYYAFSLPFYKAAPSGLKIDVVQTFTSELDSVAAGELYTMSNLYSSSGFNNTGIGTFYGNIEFDGVDDYIDFGNTPEMTGLTDITVSAWFYVNKFKTPTSIIAARYSNITAANGWELAYNDDGVVWFGGRENSSEFIFATSSFLIKQSNMGLNGATANGGWYNAVGIKRGNEWSISVTETNRFIEVNNIAKVEKSDTMHMEGMRKVTAGNGTTSFGVNTLYVGMASNLYHMNGRLMTLSVYNRALSLEEINRNYDAISKRVLKVNGILNPLLPFDYMIVTYQYRSDDYQRDLDSATFFMNTGTVEDYKRVGCGQNAPTNSVNGSHWCTPTGTRTINTSYLYQAGDDVGNGLGESIVINFKQMELDAISLNNDVRVELYAGWCLHGNQISGDVTNINVTTYIGGTMTITNNVITSNGTVIESFTKTNSPAVAGCCGVDPLTGKSQLGTIYYNLATKIAGVKFY